MAKNQRLDEMQNLRSNPFVTFPSGFVLTILVTCAGALTIVVPTPLGRMLTTCAGALFNVFTKVVATPFGKMVVTIPRGPALVIVVTDAGCVTVAIVVVGCKVVDATVMVESGTEETTTVTIEGVDGAG